MAGHTPGPWRAVRRADGDIEICAGEDESPLATFYGDEVDTICWPVSANARLGAAAPEMVVMLRDYVYLHDQETGSECNCMHCLRIRAILEKVDGD